MTPSLLFSFKGQMNQNLDIFSSAIFLAPKRYKNTCKKKLLWKFFFLSNEKE